MDNQYTDSQEKEMDLKDLFDVIKSGFYSVVAAIFKAIDFIVKFWWVILLLAAIGYAVGYFTQGSKEYTTTLIVKTNYGSQAYIYNALEQFQNHLRDRDNKEFLKEADLANIKITKVTIKPIIDVVELLSDVTNDRAMTAIIKEIELEDDESIFASEEFYSNYDYHKLEIKVLSQDAEEDIRKMIAYINKQPQMMKIAQVAKANFIERTAYISNSLKQIDGVIKVYTQSIDYATQTAKQTGFYINDNTLDIRELFDIKRELTEENEELKNEVATMEGALYPVSNFQFKQSSGLLKNKRLLYAILFVCIFLFLGFLKYCFVSLKTEVRARNLV